MNSTKITEEINSNSIDINKKSTADILKIFNTEDIEVIKSINNILIDLEKLIEDVIECFKNQGRLFYVGSGTSGRLGVLDAAECPPTFGTDSNMVQAIIAGGTKAIFKSIENAEDSEEEGVKVIIDKKITDMDIVIGISASGSTPYVLGALKKSNELGAITALIQCNHSKKNNYINHQINVIVGPEIIAGSTRMKAGTATKIILNMITTVSMVKINKTHGNIMSDLKIANKKLFKRGINIISNILSIDKLTAEKYLIKSKGNIKSAIIMYKLKLPLREAKKILSKNNNSLSGIID